MNWAQRLDPRLRLSTAIGWAVVAVVTLAALFAASLAASQAEQRARADAEGRLEEYATQVRDAASMTLEMRSLLLQVVAVQLGAVDVGHPIGLRHALQSVRQRFAEFDGLALIDSRGQVLRAAGAGPALHDIARRSWFAAAHHQPIVSDVAAMPSGSARELIIASPLDQPAAESPADDAEPEPRILVASLPWSWFESVLERMQDVLGRSRELELMLASRDGTVLMGPADWVGRNITVSADLAENGRYVVGRRTQLRLADGLGLGWTVVVRQRAELTLAPVHSIRQTVFVIVFLAGLCSAVAAVVVTRMLTRRLQRLAQAAEQVRRGASDDLIVPRGADEVAAIGTALSELVGHLQAEKRSLQKLNAELDQRVAERTARIERMNNEARMAAVSRERLRLARDLHDTLAHSLMALLTQIRLVRKLRNRLGAEELDAELGRAEAVAATGLDDAHAAITQMRDNSVRDTGFGSAVRDLVKRFGQRTGLPVRLEVQADADAWLDERFEAAFRIVEESLQNIERHAGASTVEVSMHELKGPPDSSDTRACIAVADDGCGFDTEVPQPGHFGLRGMREQAALIDAELRVHSAPGGGTRVVLELVF